MCSTIRMRRPNRGRAMPRSPGEVHVFGVVAMAEPAEQRMSLAAFLGWDYGTDTRYELLDGRPRAMVPPTLAHGTIVANLARHIGNR
jgi:hypothetical protein